MPDCRQVMRVEVLTRLGGILIGAQLVCVAGHLPLHLQPQQRENRRALTLLAPCPAAALPCPTRGAG
jgi:hypothetical protein